MAAVENQLDLFAGKTAVTIGATIACRCGHAESFEGGLLASIEASQDSQRWFLDKRGFSVCTTCAEQMTEK